MSRNKKNQKKKDWASSDEEISPIIATVAESESEVEVAQIAKKSKAKAKKMQEQKVVTSFSALMMDDSNNDEDEQSEKSESEKEEIKINSTHIPVQVPQKKKKSKNTDGQDDDDIEKLLQGINSQKSGKKKKEKAGNNQQQPVVTTPLEDDETGEDHTRIKSKKEKEKERKERQKALKKAAEKKSTVQETSSTAETLFETIPTATTTVKPKAKKSGAPIAALKHLLELQKQAEAERLALIAKQEAEIAEQEARELALENERLEKKKEKKEKERQRVEELKKSGMYLTNAQKKAMAVKQQKLDALLKSGVVKVEGLIKQSTGDGTIEVKKKPVYGKRKPKTQVKEVKEKSWDDSDSDQGENVKESWDASEPEEVEEDENIIPTRKVTISIPSSPLKSAPISPTRSTSSKKSVREHSLDKEEFVRGEVSESGDDTQQTATQKQALHQKEEAIKRKHQKHLEALSAQSKDNLRSPIGCILGHVDTGKTKLLDRIRQTNVQEGEAGGITQQIGATYFPIDAIKLKTAKLNESMKLEYTIPGLLIIDTPGHESFTNLRSRGSSLCNIAILVVDIMHGLEPQTIESLNLLKQRKTPFIVALNKIDRIYGWKPTLDYPVRDSLAMQDAHVVKEYEERVRKTVVAFAEQGMNACLYYENKNFAKNVSLVPTSAITGEGIPDMLNLVIQLCQTRMSTQLMYLSELSATVLEVKVIEGLGTTIDVILTNGVLNEGDRIVVCGMNGAIVTTVRALLTPQPMKELRVKSAYIKHKQCKASLGVKVCAADLEKAVAGSRVLVCGEDDDEEAMMEDVMSDFNAMMGRVDKSGKGVCVQASTLGSLEALLVFLEDMKIPVSGINIGPVHKKDVIRASVMLERAREYAQLLCFDVPIDKDAEHLAEETGVKIFKADIIYHLFDSYKKYMAELMEQKRKDEAPQAVFPCILRIVPGAVFNKRSPLVMGVDVIEGQLRVGTPLCVINAEKDIVTLGKVTSIELNHKQRDLVKRGEPSVAIKVEVAHYETPRMFTRHFNQDDELLSRMSRASIDILKTTFRNDLSKEEWGLVVKLKKRLNID